MPSCDLFSSISQLSGSLRKSRQRSAKQRKKGVEWRKERASLNLEVGAAMSDGSTISGSRTKKGKKHPKIEFKLCAHEGSCFLPSKSILSDYFIG